MVAHLIHAFISTIFIDVVTCAIVIIAMMLLVYGVDVA
jgi:hypothetical protein